MRLVLAVAICALVLGLSVSGLASDFDWTTVAGGSGYNQVNFEDFTYGDGNLKVVAPTRWAGTTGARAYVRNTILEMQANNAGITSEVSWDIPDLTPATKKIVLGMRFKAGGGNKCTNQIPIFAFEALDANGVVLGALCGYKSNDTDAFYVWGQVGAMGGVGPNPPGPLQTSRWQLGAGWIASWMVINTSAKTVQFLWNDGVLHDYGTLSYGAYSQNGTLGKIRIEAFGPTNTSRPWIEGDNMTYGYIPEPSSLMALGAFGIGLLGLMRRRRA